MRYHYGQTDPDVEPGPADLHEDAPRATETMDERHARDMRLDRKLADAHRLLGLILEDLSHPGTDVLHAARAVLKRERDFIVARWN